MAFDFASISSYFLEHNRYLNILGIFVILLIAFIFSKKKSKIKFRLVFTGLFLQFLLCFLVLKVPESAVKSIEYGVQKIYSFGDDGIRFVFGALADESMAWGVIFAIKVLAIMIFFGALMSLLHYLKIIQLFVKILNFIIRPILGTSGAETLCAISNAFLGQTGGPLLIKSYLNDMTKSEFMLIMTSGMSMLSASIIVVYNKMGVPINHLLAASAMAIPGSILISKILIPETEKPKTLEGKSVKFENDSPNIFAAVSSGTSDGLQMALNVGAMLISFLAIISMLNAGIGFVSLKVYALFGLNWPELSLNLIFSYIFAPFSYLLGFVGQEAAKVGELIGAKVTLNEMIAYMQMVKTGLPVRTIAILTYALCGFANFSSIGMQIGGIGALTSSEKKLWLTQLGLYALLGGTLSNLMSAMIASLLI